ncbi:MAG: hypothetical protein HKN21_04775 [Candidatus Eisenbacteria bacterium]|uniref:Hcy-binding domain-containing protein n=1 Tax=Eiseniibacteriota bacterium TaxID=2212470 RepID=A0A7Y2H1V0_UNCEI|nr:hypothetical protein [Candidatus Eisenbacteria bacterium]
MQDSKPPRSQDSAFFANGPLLFGGPLGTRLILEGFEPPLEPLNASHPEAVAALHQEDVAAGCDAVLTNTFSAASFDSSPQDRAVVVTRAVVLARDSGAKFVFGSMAPPGREDPVHPYLQTARQLLASGVDGLILQTFLHLQDVERALELLRDLPVPIAVLMTPIPHWKFPAAEFAALAEKHQLFAIGVGCGAFPSDLEPALESLKPATSLPLIALPAWDRNGHLEDHEIERFGAFCRDQGVQGLGGCCGIHKNSLALLHGAYRDLV